MSIIYYRFFIKFIIFSGFYIICKPKAIEIPFNIFLQKENKNLTTIFKSKNNDIIQ
jgi:hypothetical protein